MSNIKRLQMASAVCNDERISISSSFFGLTSRITYKATGSTVDADILEFTPEDGKQLRAIVDAPRSQLALLATRFHPRPTVNGHYMLEMVRSRDHAYVALRLYQFLQMQYEPVTDVLTYEGDEARLIAQIF